MTELRPETRALLDRAREVAPLAAEDRARIKRAVATRIANASPPVSLAAARSWRLRAGKIALIAAALVGSAAVFARATRPARPGDDAHVVVTPAPSAIAAASTSPVREVASAVAPIDPAPAPIATAPSPTPAARREKPAPATHGEARESQRGPAGQEPAAATSTLRDEALLVRGAHQALLAGDPDRALRLLEEHATRFPSGALEPERAAEHAVALCRAGRADEARRETARFEGSHAGSPLLARIRAACGGD